MMKASHLPASAIIQSMTAGNVTTTEPTTQPGALTPMSALDPFLSLDGQIQKIRQDHDTKLKAANDQLMAAQIELAMTQKALAERTQERDQSERVALKLVTQFGMVEKIFSEAKALALSFEATHGGGTPGEKKTDHTMIDGIEPPPPTHNASWQHPETEKWYDAIPSSLPGTLNWLERPPSQIEFEPSDETKTLITGQLG